MCLGAASTPGANGRSAAGIAVWIAWRPKSTLGVDPAGARAGPQARRASDERGWLLAFLRAFGADRRTGRPILESRVARLQAVEAER